MGDERNKRQTVKTGRPKEGGKQIREGRNKSANPKEEGKDCKP